jgi:hypothetical protein
LITTNSGSSILITYQHEKENPVSNHTGCIYDIATAVAHPRSNKRSKMGTLDAAPLLQRLIVKCIEYGLGKRP